MVVHAYYPLGEVRVEREALALIDHGYEVDVLCLRNADEAKEECVKGVNVYRLPVRRDKARGNLLRMVEYIVFMLLAATKLLGLYRRRRYGVVQTHNLPDFLVFAALGPKLFGARVILDLHDLMPEFYAARADSGMNSWAVRLVIWQERLACMFADRVITVTDVWRETLIRRGVPAAKVFVVMNVADSRIFHRNPAAVPARHTNGRFELIYHGAMTHRYGVDLIIQALAKVRQAIPGIHLRLIGVGDARDDLIRLTEELGLGQYVEFSRQVLHVSQLPPLIMQAEAGVVPNRNDLFTDTLLPTKLLEYVALETPVIAARTQTISSYFDDSMIKFFRPDDADDLAACILELYRDRSQLQRLAENAAKFTQTHSWAAVSAHYVALVDSLQPGNAGRSTRN